MTLTCMMVPISERFRSVILKLSGQKGLLDTIRAPSFRSANLIIIIIIIITFIP